VLPADHAIGDDSEFREVILYGQDVANTKLPNGEYPLVTLGIKPTKPETGYGYIKESPEILHSTKRFVAKGVSKFIEKPGLRAAKGFISQGGYYWNSGIFIWKSSTIIKEYSGILPGWYKYFKGISNSIENQNDDKKLMEFYKSIEGGSVDKLILERSKNSVVIPADFTWSDIGNWHALDEFLRSNDSENISIGNCISIDSSSSLFFGDKRLIAAVGVKDLVVVETDDVILVLRKRKAQDVKKIVESLEDKETK
ncbi:MAG: mannose-1-phosphate guanylyltransferase, partial [Thermodesulfobacteriota bacterium]